ncbi:hypothetical protein CEXT_577261 [Caerostris extrusa]|uniref:Uncharacterized protein n=1 Tax=Caerostris extrusa TaxID=172846 RepID=A0AAV4PG63_CAEEX|nr:hypothetical protein CEXT_577261 [Caerostris extrusa]
MLRFETFAELSRYINEKENRSLIQRMQDMIFRGLYYMRVGSEHVRMYVVVIGDYGVGKSAQRHFQRKQKQQGKPVDCCQTKKHKRLNFHLSMEQVSTLCCQ